MSGEWLGVGEVARKLGVSPRHVSDVIYQGRLSREHCMMLATRWYIRAEYVPEVGQIIGNKRRSTPAGA
jgi:hypothetical protein